MTKTKSTKRALLMSALALLMCVSMFIGSTFAWFTDSVSSGVNKIIAGNLDIGVYYAYPADVVDGDVPADAWKPVTAEDSIFNNEALWEPGYTEAVFFKFVNEGTLALQYQFQIDILDEVIGKTEDGADIQLSKYINAYGCHSFQWNYQQFLFTDRDNATNPAGAPDPYYDTLYNAANAGVNRADNYTENALSLDAWQWLDPTETTYATLVLWMPTTVGNEANHDGENVPYIDLGVTVLATQYTYESDSFDDQYDAGAILPSVWDGTTTDNSWKTADADGVYHISSAAQFVDFMNTTNHVNGQNNYGGSTIVLDCDIDLGGREIVGVANDSNYFAADFDGQGYTISNFVINQPNRQFVGLFAQVNDYNYGTGSIKNLTVEGATVIGLKSVGAVIGSAQAKAGYAVDNCKAINCTVIATEKRPGGVVGYIASGVTVTNCYAADSKIISYGALSSTEDEDCSVIGYNNPTTPANVVSNNTSSNVTIVRNATVVSTSDELASALTKGGNIILSNDIDMSEWSSVNANYNAFAIDGNGYSILNLAAPLYSKMGPTTSSVKNLTFVNAKINVPDDNEGAGVVVGYMNNNGGGKLTIDNCHVVDSEITAYKWAGAFVGANASDAGDVEITNCTVKNTVISTTDSSCGAIIGHTYANTVVKDCQILGATSISCAEDREGSAAKAGYVVGTVNAGTTTITNVSVDSTVTLSNVNSAEPLNNGYVGRNYGTVTVQ